MTDTTDTNDRTEPTDSTSESADISISRRKMLGFVGASAATPFTGDRFTSSNREFEAEPMGLSAEGMGRLNHGTLTHEALTDEHELPGLDSPAEVTSHVVAHGASEEETTEVPEGPFRLTYDADRNVGVLSTPSLEVDGQSHNPLATEPLREIVASDRGRSMLARLNVVPTADFEWSQRPEPVGMTETELLGRATRIESHFGAIDGETLVLVHAARAERNGTAVIVVGARARRADGTGACVSGGPGEYEFDHECMQETVEDVGIGAETTIPCPEPLAGNVETICGESDSSIDRDDWPNIDIGNLRLVQKVENTTVEGASHTEPDPDLVQGDETAPVFEFTDFENLEEIDRPMDVEVTVYRSDGSKRTFDFRIDTDRLEDIRNGASEIATFHEMAHDAAGQNDPPVFSISDMATAVEVELQANEVRVLGDTARTTDVTVEEVGPLTVGFMQIRDSGKGTNYGDSGGWVRAYGRTVNTVMEYLQRTFPGPVLGYRHDHEYFFGGVTTDRDGDDSIDDEGDYDIRTDLRDVRRYLDTVPNESSFPQGRLYTDGYATENTTAGIIEQSGFDVTVAIVPNDVSSNSQGTSYFDHHGSDFTGVFWNHNCAVAVTGGAPNGQGRWISTLGAQEVGHYFQKEHYSGPSGHPMAQRDNRGSDATVNNVPVDTDHARHLNSDLRDRDVDNDGQTENFQSDAPGVTSVAYDLSDGTFSNVQSFDNPDGNFSVNGPNPATSSVDRLESFMSYGGPNGQLWTDARQHQDMIDHGWEWPNQSGSTSSGAVLSASIEIGDDGRIAYPTVTAYEGFPRYVEHEEAPVRVSLLGPNGERIDDVRVPATTTPSHGEPDEGATGFLLPFPAQVAAVETEFGGTTARMNPIERSVRDAVGRVPERGYAIDPERAREMVEDTLDRVADQMAEGQYGTAAEAMAGDLRRVVEEGIREDYSEAVNEPGRSRLLALVDDAIERLQLLAEAA